jgi:hypothetical protein
MKVPAGRCSDFQLVPPSVVATMTAASDELYPPAKQTVLVGHDTL